uniref:Uncharacterized protein n=1 Tax=Setaria italica TaxID=4555 RepID=K3YZM4_SETIT
MFRRAQWGKLTVIINEGNIRPVVPLVAAKFATECNIAVMNHVPAKFDIDTNDAIVRKGCLEMQYAVRQQRHRLKQKKFDPFPLNLVTKTSPVKSTSNEQWIDLVESWKTPSKM